MDYKLGAMKAAWEATADWARVKELDAVLICVPTPLNENREPDLSFVLSTGQSIASHLPKMPSYLNPQPTQEPLEDELKPILEQGQRMESRRRFYLKPIRLNVKTLEIRKVGSTKFQRLSVVIRQRA